MLPELPHALALRAREELEVARARVLLRGGDRGVPPLPGRWEYCLALVWRGPLFSQYGLCELLTGVYYFLYSAVRRYVVRSSG